jgi:hypothetical protein
VKVTHASGGKHSQGKPLVTGTMAGTSKWAVIFKYNKFRRQVMTGAYLNKW